MPTEATPITLICPRLSCRAVLQVPAMARGQRVRCAECGMTLVVPATAKPRRQGRLGRSGDRGQPTPAHPATG